MFGFPTVVRKEDHQFKSNLLKSVVFQVKFEPNQEVLKKKDFFNSKLSNEFPNLKDIMQQEGKFRFSPEGTPVLESASSSHAGFEFKSSDNFKVLAITVDSLTLTIFGKNYTNSSEVIRIFEEKYTPLLNEIGVTNLNRVAIRKVNMLEAVSPSAGSEQNYKVLLDAVYNNSLISNVQVMPSNSFLDRGLSYISLKTNDGYKLNLSYGLMQEDSKRPGVRQLTFDIDVFKFGVKVPTSKLTEEFKKINTEVYNIFVWGIKPELVRSLNGEHNG